MPFTKRLKALRKDFEHNIKPVLRRHSHARTKAQREREKHFKALKRVRRAEMRIIDAMAKGR